MPVEAATFVGKVLASGRYEILHELGAGGMAFVYLAHDRQDKRDIVVKVPRQAMLEDPEFVGRFMREARSLVRFRHAHIAKILDAGEHEGRPYLVLEYLSGGSLRDRLSSGPHRPQELKAWLPAIASALDFCHENGCVHRDVKPDNILFDARGKAYLSDFGIAKLVRDRPNAQTVVTGTGIVLGTAQYMAPEVVLGKPYDGRADQYGLAITVYEVLSGKVPFAGDTPGAVFIAQSTQEPPPLHTLSRRIPKSASIKLQRALAKAPNDRFASCSRFASAFLAEIEGEEEPVPAKAVRSKPPPLVARDTVTVTCSECGRWFRIPREDAEGELIECRHCQILFSPEDDERTRRAVGRRRGGPSLWLLVGLPVGVLLFVMFVVILLTLAMMFG